MVMYEVTTTYHHKASGGVMLDKLFSAVGAIAMLAMLVAVFAGTDTGIKVATALATIFVAVIKAVVVAVAGGLVG